MCRICDVDSEHVDAIVDLEKAEDEIKRLRAELQRVCRHPATFDSLPASCCTCGKEL